MNKIKKSGAGYGRQAHNLKVAGSNPAPQPKFNLPLIFDVRMTSAEIVFSLIDKKMINQ